MRFLVPALALLLTAAVHLPAVAQSSGQSNAVEIEACMREFREGAKTGQKQAMTPQQRMVAEEQCRARVESAKQSPTPAKK